MNKYLLLSAAAIFASTGARASNFATICFNGDPVVQLNYSGNNYNAVFLLAGGGYAFDIAGKTKGLGRHITLDDPYLAQNYGIYSQMYAFDIAAPPKNGRRLTEWLQLDGTTAFEVNGGSYTVCNDAKAKSSPAKVVAQTRILMQQIAADRHAAKRN